MEKLEKIFNYKFDNKLLLQEALTHPSMSCKQKEKFNYERLEFLGDSILSFIITEYIFSKHPKETEGELSKRKAFLVSKNTLYSIAKNLNLGEFIILTVGEENCDGRNNINNLENILESILGAIYLDSNIEIVKKIILNIWSKIDDTKKEPPEYPKTELQIWTQKYIKQLPVYSITNIGDKKNPLFLAKLKINKIKEVEATGHSIKDAENKAALLMLDIIRKKSNYSNDRL